MNFKKLGFLALTVLTVLGMLGVGYAMWFQTITINGTVNTGKVTLEVGNYTGTWGYKDIDATAEGEDPFDFVTGAGYAGNQPLPADYNSDDPSDHVLIGYAEVETVNKLPPATVDCTAGAINIVMNWWNLFPASDTYFNPDLPDRDWCADFDVTNTGTIPVRFVVVNGSVLNTTPNHPTVTVSYTNAAGGITLEGYQLEPGQTVHVEICVSVLETTAQGYNGSFSLTIYGVQWNEYGQPIPTLT